MHSIETDRELVVRLRKGDSGALDVVLRTYWEPLVSYVRSLGADPDVAEDVIQQTLLRLWERRAELRLEGSLRGLLYRMARNLCFDSQRRRRSRERANRSVTSPTPIPSPYDDVEGVELLTAVQQALSALPKRRREVFMLVRYHGLSHREVARTLNLAPQTVANHLGLALADLRVALAPYISSRVDPSLGPLGRNGRSRRAAITGS